MGDVSRARGEEVARIGAGGVRGYRGGVQGGDNSAKRGFGEVLSRKMCEKCYRKCYRGLMEVGMEDSDLRCGFGAQVAGRPLTPALSPEYRGEGVRRGEAAVSTGFRSEYRGEGVRLLAGELHEREWFLWGIQLRHHLIFSL